MLDVKYIAGNLNKIVTKICLNSTFFQINRDFTPTRQSNRSFITFKIALTNNKQIYLNIIKMNKAINFNFELRPFFSDRQLNCTRGQAFKASHCVENLHFVTMN